MRTVREPVPVTKEMPHIIDTLSVFYLQLSFLFAQKYCCRCVRFFGILYPSEETVGSKSAGKFYGEIHSFTYFFVEMFN